jgi:hypothetical protein
MVSISQAAFHNLKSLFTAKCAINQVMKLLRSLKSQLMSHFAYSIRSQYMLRTFREACSRNLLFLIVVNDILPIFTFLTNRLHLVEKCFLHFIRIKSSHSTMPF